MLDQPEVTTTDIANYFAEHDEQFSAAGLSIDLSPNSQEGAMTENVESLDHLIANRYAPSAVVVAALKNAGHLAAFKLLGMLQSPDFDKLSVGRKLQIIDLALEKAYGKSEGAAAMALLSAKLANPAGDKPKTKLTAQLAQLGDEDWVAPEMRKAEPASAAAQSAERGRSGRRSLDLRSGGGVTSPASVSNSSMHENVQGDNVVKPMFPRVSKRGAA